MIFCQDMSLTSGNSELSSAGMIGRLDHGSLQRSGLTKDGAQNHVNMGIFPQAGDLSHILVLKAHAAMVNPRSQESGRVEMDEVPRWRARLRARTFWESRVFFGVQSSERGRQRPFCGTTFGSEHPRDN